MGCQLQWRHGLARGFLAGFLIALPGCLSFVHPVDPPKPELVAPCHVAPDCARDHVHVFLVHGLDPCNCANLTGLRDYIQALGFRKTYYGQLYHWWWFEHELRRVHQEDPDAHFVLIGFSYGASMVRSLAQYAKTEGIQIDLLVYLGGNTLDNNCPYDHPDNVAMLVNILATGCIWNGTTFDGAENIKLPDVWHFGSPTHHVTLQAIARNLAVVAAGVSVPAPAQPEMPPADETAPTPRPVMPQSSAKRDEWDFLKPVSHVTYDPKASAAQWETVGTTVDGN